VKKLIKFIKINKQRKCKKSK